MIRGVRIIVGMFFTRVGFRYGEYIAHFLFLGMRVTKSRKKDCTVVCVSKNY